MGLVENVLGFPAVKEFGKFVNVIVMSLVYYFWGTQCSM